MTNTVLIENIRLQRDEALLYLVKEHRTKCVGYVHRSVIGESEPEGRRLAEDLFTEALIALVTNVRLGCLTELSASVGTYLTSTMKYKWLGKQRKPVREPLTYTPDEDGLEDELDDLRQSLRRHLRELGGKCRQLLTFFYFDNLSYEDILPLADHDYGTVTAARMQKVRCIQKLQRKLGVTSSSKSISDA